MYTDLPVLAYTLYPTINKYHVKLFIECNVRTKKAEAISNNHAN